MLESMRKLLAITTFFATTALLAAAIALAATPKTEEGFTGTTAHKHYGVIVTTGCTAKKCTNATDVTITVKAGSPGKAISGCPYGGYGLSTGAIKHGKFLASTEFVVSKTVLTFKVAGTFTAANKVQGTVTGVKACGGTDSFSLKGVHLSPVGATS
jgi:hypothetical protein